MRQTPFISTDEAARQLQYTAQHVRRLVREGKLNGEKVGRDWIVSSDSLANYVSVRENFSLPLEENLGGEAATPTHDPTAGTGLTVDEILSGSEPSVELKRLAKRLAWANGEAPKRTLHRVYQGDAREMREVADESVHLIVTSPPYFDLIDYEDTSETDGQLGNLRDYERFLDELNKVWQRCYDALVPGGRLCIVVGDVCVSRKQAGRHFVIPLHADIARACNGVGFDYLTPIYWSKIANMATEVGGSARFLGKPYEPNAIIKNDVEYILLLRKPGGYRRPSNAQRALSIIDPEEHRRWFRSVWSDIRGESRKAGHPAPFPAELARRLIEMFSFVGDTVLDPFWGTGSTTHAAIKASRSSIGYEIERGYIEIGQQRLSQLDSEVVPPEFEFLTSES
jgi:excisionase family DNA binding protein